MCSLLEQSTSHCYASEYNVIDAQGWHSMQALHHGVDGRVMVAGIPWLPTQYCLASYMFAHLLYI